MQKYASFLLLGFCYWVCNLGLVPLLLCAPHLWPWGINSNSLWGGELGARCLPCSPGFTLGILQVRAQGREGKSYSIKSFCWVSGELYT